MLHIGDTVCIKKGYLGASVGTVGTIGELYVDGVTPLYGVYPYGCKDYSEENVYAYFLEEELEKGTFQWIPEKKELQKKNKCLLVFSDGYTINCFSYPTFEDAKKKMQQKYQDYIPEEWEEECKDFSYITEENAVLYANGETIYLWQIVNINDLENNK